MPPTSTFDAPCMSTVLSWNGVSPGWRLRASAAMAAMVGVANELPVARMTEWSAQAISTSTPRAWNSTGGFGL